MKPGTIDLPCSSIRCVLGQASLLTSALEPTATMRVPRTATACAIWKVSLTVMIFPLNRIRSAPACCACSDSESPTTPANSSSQADFPITFLQPSETRPTTRGLYVREGQLTQPDVQGRPRILPPPAHGCPQSDATAR